MFNNYDTVICPNNIKLKILKKITEDKKIINIKFYTLNEFKNAYFGTYKKEAIYYLMKKYKYKYDVAITYLDNYYFNNELKKELEENNLIIKEEIKLKKIVVIGYNKIDKYILDEIKKYDYEIIKDGCNKYKNRVYEFTDIEEEINFVIKNVQNLFLFLRGFCVYNF